MTIEPMNEQTVLLAAALEAQCFSTPWSPADMTRELENPWAIWLTAMEGTALLGYIGIQYGPDGADIMSIATAPEFRGKGVGAALLTEMVRLLQEKNLQWLTLEVRPSNRAAIALYHGQGFTQVGRRPRYYENPREDALLLTKYFKEGESCADPGH